MMVSARAGTGTVETARGAVRHLIAINLGLVALQPVSAGLFLSGYERAVTMHAVVAAMLLLGALMQVGIASYQWLKGGIRGQELVTTAGVLAAVLLQAGLGYSKVYWLHVPIGVAMLRLLAGLSSRPHGGRRFEAASS